MATNNSINVSSSGIVKYDGTGAFTGITVTQHDILVGAASNGITSVVPSATSGVPLVSQGAAADPAFGTAVVAGGGTGQTTLTNHGVLVGAGTSAITQLSVASTGTVLIGNTGADPSFSATPTVTSITISNAPSAGTDGTNKTYVDTAIAAVNPSTSVYAATTTNIPGTYLNGAAGIGATFLTTATGTFTLDGTTPPLLSRILFKDQSTTFQNGVYTLTTNGTGITGSTFTRAVDYDQSSDINSTGVIAVVNGTVNQLTGWLLNVNVTNVGADPITYIKYNNAPVTVTQYDVLVGGASNTIVSVGPGSAGQVLQSAGNASNPAYSTPTYPSASGSTGVILRSDGTNNVYTTATYPATTTANQILYSSATNVVSGLATANQGVLTTGATGTPVITALGTNGQLIIGSTAGVPAAATLTAGSGIAITNGSNSITITASGAGFAWSDNSGTFTAAAANGYFITTTSTPTLPASPSEGDTVAFIVDTTNICTITGNTGQKIRVGGTISAAAGTCANNARGDTITLVYRSTGTTWFASYTTGTWTVT